MNEVRNILVGLDFGEKVSQMCYYDRKDEEPVSIPVKVGTGQYTFPNCISKKPGEEQWHFGLEAEYFANQQDELYLDNLYEICSSQRKVTLDDQEWDAGELFGIFLLQVLRMLGVPDPIKSVSGLTITAPKLSRVLVENVRVACSYMGFSRKRCFLQDYEESFYYHTLYQKPEFWSRSVGLFTFDQDEVAYAKLNLVRNTKPVQVSVKRGKRVTLRKDTAGRDTDFHSLIQESLGDEIYSTIYIVGEGFEQSWARRSTALLCQHQRHVFYGNNLYAKGACFAAKEKTEERNLKGYLYLGSDLVKMHVGMDLLVQGTPAYYPLVVGGVNWYEAAGDCEVLLDDRTDLQFLVTDMETSKKERYSMPLPNLPSRPPKASRLHVHVEFEAANRFRIEAEDMGFGEMYPSSGLVWKEEMSR